MAKPAELIEAKIKALLAYCHSRKKCHQEQQQVEKEIRDQYSRCYEEAVQRIILPKKIYKSKMWLSRLLTRENTPKLNLRSYLLYSGGQGVISHQKSLRYSPNSPNRPVTYDSPPKSIRVQDSPTFRQPIFSNK